MKQYAIIIACLTSVGNEPEAVSEKFVDIKKTLTDKYPDMDVELQEVDELAV